MTEAISINKIENTAPDVMQYKLEFEFPHFATNLFLISSLAEIRVIFLLEHRCKFVVEYEKVCENFSLC
jgi:hypothetical protein